MRFSSLPLKYKMPVLMTGLCLSSVVALQLINNAQFRTTSVTLTEEAFDALASSRKKAIEYWIDDAKIGLLDLSTQPEILARVPELTTARAQLSDPTRTLQAAYIDNNPNPPGQRQALDRGPGTEAYHDIHAAINPMLRNYMERHDTYDVFLFDTELNNLYTTAKETDFAAEFGSGPLADSSMGRALRKAEAAQLGDVITADYASYAPSGGALAAFMVTKVAAQDGQVLGYVGIQLDGDALISSLADRAGLGETGRTYIIGTISDGTEGKPFLIGTGVDIRVGAKAEDAIGMVDPANITPVIEAAMAGQTGILSDVALVNGEIGMADVLTLDVDGKGVTWSVVVERENTEIFAPLNALILKMMLIGAGIAALVTMAGMFFARTINRPIARVADAIKGIADGDLDTQIADVGRQDEVGDIAKSLEALRHKLGAAREVEQVQRHHAEAQRTVVEALSQGMQDLASGDLSRPIVTVFTADYEALRLDFNSVIDKLAETMTQVVEASQSIRARSGEISSASEDLSRRTENQAAALEETAAALDELTASVKSAADSSRDVEDIVRQARKQAEDSGVVVQGAVSAMSEIEKSSDQITQIIGAIDDIAFQTNLLALNAGVEAARAGDAGKGFAVVASEVRALAQRSSAAAKEIKALIGTSAQHVRRGVDQVGKAGEALHNIVGSVTNISSLVSTIAVGASEQSHGLAEINIGVTQLDQVTQQNAAMVEQSTAASHSLSQDAAGLAELVSVFNLPKVEGAESRVVALSQFAPKPKGRDSTASTTKAAWDEFQTVKVADGGGKGVWQDF